MSKNEQMDELLVELRELGKNKFPLSKDGKYDPDAKVSLWYVIARIEEAMLKGE